MENLIRIDFHVHVPNHIDGPVFLCGNLEETGSWSDHLIELSMAGEDFFKTSLLVSAGTELEYKFSLGKWSMVETDLFGRDIPNRKLIVKENGIVEIKIERFRNSSALPAGESITGNLQTIRNFESKILGNSRDIYIWLPPDYENSCEEYPVVYMHDGNNLFSRNLAYAAIEWEVDEVVSRLIDSNQICKLIIIGISNNENRKDEYTPFSCPENGGGLGEKYLLFLEKELIPEMESRFRIKKDRNFRAMMGSSLGGLISLWANFSHDHLFSMFGVISPALYWKNQFMLSHVKNMKKRNTKIFMDLGVFEFGSNETKHRIYLEDIRNMKIALEEIGYDNNDLFYFEDPKGAHNEKSWAKRIHMPFLWFFSTNQDKAKGVFQELEN